MADGDGIVARAWRTAADFGAIAGLVSDAWNGPRRPLVSITIGDLEWWTALGGANVDWSRRIRLWERHGALAAWGWFKPPIELDWFIGDAVDQRLQDQIRDDLFTWHEASAREALAAGPPATADSEPPMTPVAAAVAGNASSRRNLETWAADGWPEAAALAARDWTPGDLLLSQYHQLLDLDLDPPRVPDGYVLRTMHGPADIPRRVEVHRAAFAPSKVTVETYDLVVQQPHYAYERDVVVEAPDGTFAAFAMCWLDPTARVGEFEPVGVHPDHQRHGLGRVVMRHGLRLLRDSGASDAIVFSLRSNAASEALYRSAGFTAIATHRVWTRPVG